MLLPFDIVITIKGQRIFQNHPYTYIIPSPKVNFIRKSGKVACVGVMAWFLGNWGFETLGQKGEVVWTRELISTALKSNTNNNDNETDSDDEPIKGTSRKLAFTDDDNNEDNDEDAIKITTIKNYYLDGRIKTTERYNPCYETIRMKHPMLGGLVAPSGIGKTNILLNLIELSKDTFAKIVVVHKVEEPLYDMMINPSVFLIIALVIVSIIRISRYMSVLQTVTVNKMIQFFYFFNTIAIILDAKLKIGGFLFFQFGL